MAALISAPSRMATSAHTTPALPSGLEMMLNELESHQLVTILAPSKRGENPWDMIRVNMDMNTKWYQKFCASYQSKRKIRRGKFDTIIRRANVLRALNQMLAGKPAGKYAPDLQNIADEMEKKRK